MMQIVTNQSQKELKSHGSYQFPILVSYERLSLYETGSFLWHWHPEIELTLILEGHIQYRVSHRSFCLEKGQALFCSSGSLHAGTMIQGQDCRYVSVTFDPRLIYGYENSLIHERYVLPLLNNPELDALVFDGSQSWHQEAAGLIRSLAGLHDEKPAAWEMSVVLKLMDFWRLLSLHISSTASRSPRDRLNYERICAILSYIKTHYSQKITLEDIAAQVHLCPGECSRLFGQYMNQPLFQFILEYRVEKSLPLLSDPSLSITEIAARTGFCDSNYFSRVFLRFKGISPSAYRKKKAALQPEPWSLPLETVTEH